MEPSQVISKAEIKQTSDVCIYESIHSQETKDHDLYTTDCMEISLVTSGNGIHRILNQDIPCKEGDIYITTHTEKEEFFHNAVRYFQSHIRNQVAA